MGGTPLPLPLPYHKPPLQEIAAPLENG